MPNANEVGDHRRPAVAEERRRDAGQRHQAEQAGGDQRELQDEAEREAEREEERVVAGRRVQRDAQAAPGDEREQRRQTADDAQRSRVPRRPRRGSGPCGRRGSAAGRPSRARCRRPRPRRAPRARAQPGRRREPRCPRATTTSARAAPRCAGSRAGSRPGSRRPAAPSPTADHRRAAARHAVHRQEHAGEHQRRPEVLLQEEEQQDERHADERPAAGSRGAGRRSPKRAAPPEPRLLERAQELPPVGEVAGEEQDDEHANRFDRLHAHQVDLGVARARAAAEDDQQQRQDDRAEQRHVAEAPDARALEIDAARRARAQSGRDHALREPGEQQRCREADRAG